MPYPAEKSKITNSYTRTLDTPVGVKAIQNGGFSLYCSCNAAQVRILSKIYQHCFMERLLALSHILPLLPDSSIQETQASLHFLTVRIILSPPATQSITRPSNPRDSHKKYTDRGGKMYPLPVTISVLYTFLSQPGQGTRTPSESISWPLSQTPGMPTFTSERVQSPLTITGIPCRPCVKGRTKTVSHFYSAIHPSDPQVL